MEEKHERRTALLVVRIVGALTLRRTAPRHPLAQADRACTAERTAPRNRSVGEIPAPGITRVRGKSLTVLHGSLKANLALLYEIPLSGTPNDTHQQR